MWSPLKVHLVKIYLGAERWAPQAHFRIFDSGSRQLQVCVSGNGNKIILVAIATGSLRFCHFYPWHPRHSCPPASGLLSICTTACFCLFVCPVGVGAKVLLFMQMLWPTKCFNRKHFNRIHLGRLLVSSH